MAKTLEQILGFQNLTGVIANPAGGVPNLLPEAFQRPGRPVVGKTATWYEVAGNRRTAKLVQYGAPSVRRSLKGVSERSAVMMHTHEHILHDATVLIQLRNMDNPTAQRMGEQIIAAETAQFRAYFSNLRVSSIMSILTLGAIYFDGDGELLPSSSGAVTTVDFSVPANNKNQINGIIGTTWATDTVDIIGDIKAIKSAAIKGTGYPLAHAFYGENILEYLMSNNAVKELLKTRTDYANAMGVGEIPDGFMGMQWHSMEQGFFADSADTNQTWFGGDVVTFTPEPSPDWWEIFQGSYPVPTALGRVGADASDSAGDIAQVNGMFSYAKILDDPVSIKHNAGDTFLPTLKVPGCIYIADVVP